MSFKFGKNGGKATPHVTHLIDIATDAATQPSENWTMFMEICDLINSSEEGPKDAIKAIRKKFATKNPPTIKLSLSLIETCVKNCGKRFHIHIATKDFLQDFIKIISPKHSPPIDLQMTVLGLLQTWAYAFQTSPELKEVCKQYQELKNKGVEFPPLDVEKATQAHIPAKSTPTVAVTDLRNVNARTHSTLSSAGQPCMPARGTRSAGHGGVPATLTPDHMAKLHSELNTVQQNCRVFGEMLTELTPGQENRSDIELLEDLNLTCRQMQKRIMELIQVVQMEQVTEELLRINDELNNAFLRYDRYQRLRSNQPNQKLQPTGDFSMPPAYSPSAAPGSQSTPMMPMPGVHATMAAPYPPAASGGIAVDNLIDLGETPSPKPVAPYPVLDSQFNNMSIHDGTSRVGLPQSGDEFGLFAGTSETNRADPVVNPAKLGRDTEFEEMEKWLIENTGGVGTEGATSSEFDQFLSERAREADRLPAARSTQGQGPSTGQKVDDAALFSL